MSETHTTVEVALEPDVIQATVSERSSVATIPEGQQSSQERASVTNGLYSLETASSNSSSSAPLGDMAGAKAGQHYQPKKDILTRIECITDFQMKVILTLIDTGQIAALVILISELVYLVHKADEINFGHRLIPELYNVIIGGICLGAQLAMLCWVLERIIRSMAMGKVWRHRRKRGNILVILELIVMILNSVAFIFPNAYLLGCHCCNGYHHAIGWSAFARWSCWNTIFLLVCMTAHNANPYDGPVHLSRLSRNALPPRSDGVYWDAPLAVHIPKLCLWIIFEAMIGMVAFNRTYGEFAPAGPSLCGQLLKFPIQDCSESVVEQVFVGLLLGCSMVFFLLWIWYIYHGKHVLNQRAYNDYKVGNMLLRLQERSRWPFIILFTISFTVLWYSRINTCAAIKMTWLGLLSIQVMATFNTIAWCWILMPNEPRDKTPTLQCWLQEHAWTTQDMLSLRALWDQHSGTNTAIRDQPIFCFELAMKAFYWSGLVYDGKSVRNYDERLSWGMELMETVEHDVMAEELYDSKALFAWGPKGGVLSFRGTASFKNCLTDIRAWSVLQYPSTTTSWWLPRPRVHSGFSRAWRANSFSDIVVSRVCGVAQHQSTQVDRPWPLLITGHSMGGALAMLAAPEITTALQQAGNAVHVSCYTFGAPRTGNHAFAREYARLVPDTWGLINDQDIVARRGKMCGLYKRPGHRVIVNPRGDLIVRPTYGEASVHRTPGGGSMINHYLASYQQALLAICLAQFSSKRYRTGMRGVLSLAEGSSPFARLFEQELGLSIPDMIEMSSMEGRFETPSKRLKPIRFIRRSREGWGHPADPASPVRPAGDSGSAMRNSLCPATCSAFCCAS
ncbi:hypothetical protein WJX74_009103 [Apatococcus lobatus]|uniref:Fungal lipase-type domain-containing protein n=1 Tax=Apatococcus lobatus TaxID=904363 RepID=A0AAW1QBN3_9CHLO